MSDQWREGKVMLSIRASIMGCLAVHKNLDTVESEYNITHVGTGYKIPTGGTPLPKSKIACQSMAEDLINKIPNLDEFFTLLAGGRETIRMRNEIMPEIFKIERFHADNEEAE